MLLLDYLPSENKSLSCLLLSDYFMDFLYQYFFSKLTSFVNKLVCRNTVLGKMLF